jgi:hypothetical protein
MQNVFRTMVVASALCLGMFGCSGGGGAGAAMPAALAVANTAAGAGLIAAAKSPVPATPTAGVASATPVASAPPVAPPTASAAATATAAPTASATPAQVAALAPLAYPVYSSFFKAKTPFHDTVAQLMNAGATVLSPTVAQNYWAQGLNENNRPFDRGSGTGAIYDVHAGDPAYIFACPTYGTCNASGMSVHYPAGATPAVGSDHHLISFDTTYANAEVDGWGGAGSNPCSLAAGLANCSWGGVFPFSGNGLATDGSAANAGGYAYGVMDVTAQELLNGHIDHALGIISSCLDNGGVYPSGVGKPSDATCPANLEPNAVYGDLIVLKPSVNVASLGYSHYCQVIVQALQTYGAYTADTNGSYGIGLEVEYPQNPAYVTDPWDTIIFPAIAAGGDGTGSGTGFNYQTCLQRIPASDIEVIAISPILP